MTRRESKKVRIGNLVVGGGAPILVQSMLNVPAGDIDGNIAQAKALEAAGCEIIRVAIPDRKAVSLIPAIKKEVKAPLLWPMPAVGRISLSALG